MLVLLCCTLLYCASESASEEEQESESAVKEERASEEERESECATEEEVNVNVSHLICDFRARHKLSVFDGAPMSPSARRQTNRLIGRELFVSV